MPGQVSSATLGCSTFGRGRLYPTGSWAYSVGAGQFTRDRRVDIAVATEDFADGANDHKVFVFRQTRDNRFRQYAKLRGIYSYNSSRPIGTGDFNQDGRTDIALGAGDSIVFFFQRRNSTFRRHQMQTNFLTVDLIVTDLNQDGRRDIVSAGDGIHYLLKRKGSGWRHGEIAVRGPRLMAVGNVVGRKRPDVVVVHERYRHGYWLVVYAQRKDGTFRKLRGEKLNMYGVSLDVSEVTGDSRKDALLVQEGVLAVYPGRRDRKGLRTNPSYYPTQDGSGPVRGYRMNADRRRDVVTIHGGWNEIGALCQERDGSLAEEVTSYTSTPTHLSQRGMIVRDLNGDGRPDVAYASANYGLGVAFQRRN